MQNVKKRNNSNNNTKDNKNTKKINYDSMIKGGKKEALTNMVKQSINKRIDDNRDWTKKRKEFYNSSLWKKTRLLVIERDSCIDVYKYMMTGEISILEKSKAVVHHIESLRDNFDKRLDMSNLITVSPESHGVIEDSYKDPTIKEILQALFRNAVQELKYIEDLETMYSHPVYEGYES